MQSIEIGNILLEEPQTDSQAMAENSVEFQSIELAIQTETVEWQKLIDIDKANRASALKKHTAILNRIRLTDGGNPVDNNFLKTSIHIDFFRDLSNYFGQAEVNHDTEVITEHDALKKQIIDAAAIGANFDERITMVEQKKAEKLEENATTIADLQ